MRLTEKISDYKPVLVVEFKPNDPNLLTFVGKVKPYVDAVRLSALKNAGDAKNPGRTAEQISLESAAEVTKVHRVDAITSIVCRDHPREDREILISLKESSVDNLLVLYGDPNDPPYPNYYQFQSTIELIQWIRGRESGLQDQSGRFCIAVGTNPTSSNLDREVSALSEKKQAGADLAITQPIFDPLQGKAFLERLKAKNERMPVLVSLLAPKSEKSITFMEKRIGVNIPQKIKERMKGKGVSEGLQVVRDVYKSLLSKVEGFYVCPWADPDLSVTVSLLQELRR